MEYMAGVCSWSTWQGYVHGRGMFMEYMAGVGSVGLEVFLTHQQCPLLLANGHVLKLYIEVSSVCCGLLTE